MPRYSSDHKDATRRRILDTAGRRFKQDGLDGSGIATLMADAGLTNGAFYTHFSSKNDLIAAVITDQLQAQAREISASIEGGATLSTFIATYLSMEHLRDPAGGCPSAALLTDVTRCSDDIKRAYQDGVTALVDVIVGALVSEGTSVEEAAHQDAIALITSLIGTMQLARAVVDAGVAEQVLKMGARDSVARMRQH